ncbi:MAG: hypothetical protein WKG03_01645 [Telluria sp.]
MATEWQQLPGPYAIHHGEFERATDSGGPIQYDKVDVLHGHTTYQQNLYTADQMHAFAQAAIEQSRVAGGRALCWRPLSELPKSGGTYFVGGYRDVGFDFGIGHLVITLDGPDWATREVVPFPLEYWCDIPTHPKRAAIERSCVQDSGAEPPPVPYAKHEREVLAVVDSRDRYHDAADTLASLSESVIKKRIEQFTSKESTQRRMSKPQRVSHMKAMLAYKGVRVLLQPRRNTARQMRKLFLRPWSQARCFTRISQGLPRCAHHFQGSFTRIS